MGDIYQIPTCGKGPAGQIPLTESQLREAPVETCSDSLKAQAWNPQLLSDEEGLAAKDAVQLLRVRKPRHDLDPPPVLPDETRLWKALQTRNGAQGWLCL